MPQRQHIFEEKKIFIPKDPFGPLRNRVQAQTLFIALFSQCLAHYTLIQNYIV